MPAKSKINMPMLMRVMGWLVMIEAVFMLVPLLTAWIYGEDDLRAFPCLRWPQLLPGL